MVVQPRTLDVVDMRAFDRSTSHSGNAAAQPVMTGKRVHPRTLAVGPDRIVVVGLPIGPALEHFRKRHTGFHARKRCTQAEMQTVPEAEMRTGCVTDIEAVGVGEMTLISVSRPVQQQDD